MCLAIPGILDSVFERDGLKMSKVNFDGIKRIVCLEYTPNAKVGDYVLVHVGFALSIIDEEEARRTLALLAEADLIAELGSGGEG
jgi:hydrogenase expression/formation protein HypC